MRHELLIAHQVYVHEAETTARMKQILAGELKEADHFVVFMKGCSWADKMNPGDDVQIEFGWGGGLAKIIAAASAKVLWVEKRPAGQLGKGLLRLNLGPSDPYTVKTKQFGGADFVSILHLQRKDGWKYRRQGATPAPAAAYEAAAMPPTEPLRLANGPLKALLGPRTPAEEPRNPNEHPD